MAQHTETDIAVLNSGTIILLTGRTEAGRRWLDENLEREGWQDFGDGVAVDQRYAFDILEGARDDGLEVV